MTVQRPAIRYHGAKFRLAPWIIQHFPAHGYYVEAFGGAAGVLLSKRRTGPEVYNDLDGDVVNFFRVLRDATSRQQLIDACALTPYARAEFDIAWQPAVDDIERARRLAIRAQMGFGSAGATKGSTGFRTDIKRRFTTAQMDWLAFPNSIAAAGQRFAGVLVENRPAIDVMVQHDHADALHYVDPPYVHSTRAMRSKGGYRCELTDAGHEELIDVLVGLRGMVVLSGYGTSLYADRLKGWESNSTTARISAVRGSGQRTETVWLNPACSAALRGHTPGLFAGRETSDGHSHLWSNP